jgi:hypothetical protein
MRAFFLSAVLLSVGCAAPYKFVAHAEPNPFVRPGCRIVMEPMRVDQLIVGNKPVAQYASEKSEKSADSFDSDLQQANVILHERVMAENGGLFLPGAPDNTYVMRSAFVHWEPGGFFSGAAVANVMVDVLSPNGQVLDRIAIEKRGGDYSSGGRMRVSFNKVGDAVNRYISDNWMCR